MIRLAAVLLVLAGLAAPASAQTVPPQSFPALSGRVVDAAGLLGRSQAAELSNRLAAHEARTGQQVVVVTLKGLGGFQIEDYGFQLGRHWGIGRAGKSDGALLIVAPAERRVRIEVGYGLEGTLTDAASRVIIETHILPRFRAGDMAGGIVAGADAILALLSGDASAAPPPAKPGQPIPDWAVVLLFLAVFFAIVLIARGSQGRVLHRRGTWVDTAMGSSGRSGRRNSGGAGGIIGGILGGILGGGGGGGSGGGFSGGGGSFGGGGSSGSW